MVSFQEWINITTSLYFLIISSIFFITPLLIYLIIAAFKKGKSSSGHYQTKPMICYFNTWISVLIYNLVGIPLYTFLIIYPVWLRIFE